MKYKLQYRKIVLFALTIITAINGQSQKKFTITSSRANNYCNGACTLFDNPDLNGNPVAVIFITPLEVNGINLDPHPVCAYYNGKQWCVFNTDNSTMPPGAQFEVQYYPKPDDTHFVHVVTKENLVKNNSYIDHSGLNDNPNAQFQFLQNASPNVRGGGVNKDEINTRYDAAVGKWYITNVSGKVFDFSTGYNISISESNGKTNPIVTTPVNTTTFVPGPKIDHSGQQIFITVIGGTQGQFTGENGTNRIGVPGYEMDVETAREASSGMATGRRQYSPILFQKASGAASIQFFKALVLNETLSSVIFEVYEPSTTGGGASVLSYKIVLTGARVAGFKQSFVEGQKGLVDSIKLSFYSINLTYINGGVTASDNLGPNN